MLHYAIHEWYSERIWEKMRQVNGWRMWKADEFDCCEVSTASWVSSRPHEVKKVSCVWPDLCDKSERNSRERVTKSHEVRDDQPKPTVTF